jgi:chemosensory pili system protein ChpA (sensor histidine kinase/response regulator)
VRAELLDDLVNFAGEVSIYRSRVEQQIGTFGSNLGEMDQTITRLREQLRQVEIETEAQIDSRRAEAQKQGYEDFDPLEFDRFTNMQTLSRSMAESLNDLLSIETVLRGLSRETETLLLQQSRVNTELQESLMHTRMVPMAESAPRLRRVVRQTASELGKRTALSFEGVEVEMDRNVVERMMAPLEHMLRNSIAHGIEEKTARKGAGKPDEGNITIALTREGSEIVIRVSDDGAGINLEAVKKKAIDRGLMQPGAQLSNHEIMHFILESGFSTASALTQVAGRGVGMDVVNSEIRQLGGVLEIDSVFGQGTTMTARLPLTLSVSRALLVYVGEDIYAIPLPSISGIERISGPELEATLNSERPIYAWLGDEYNLMHLTAALGAGTGTIQQETKQPLLLTNSGGHRVAFAVDGLIGSREIVVKSLGPQLSTLQHLAGATILADGSVALIIDMPALVRRGFAKLGGAAAVGATPEVAVAEREPVVMVVDDSITVRKVTERLLKRNNMKCITAKDGVDAITVLDEVTPDVMLLDIEMPRMDGFELATFLRNSERFKQLPIIMITSRTGDKHRQHAMDIGVNEYMGKPYTEIDLMANIEKLLHKG